MLIVDEIKINGWLVVNQPSNQSTKSINQTIKKKASYKNCQNKTSNCCLVSLPRADDLNRKQFRIIKTKRIGIKSNNQSKRIQTNERQSREKDEKKTLKMQ